MVRLSKKMRSRKIKQFIEGEEIDINISKIQDASKQWRYNRNEAILFDSPIFYVLFLIIGFS